MNLPNRLSLIRVCLVPVFVLFVMLPLPDVMWRCVAAAVFIITALTDMLDGKIARKNNMVTDFGKFIDPLADKFMIFGALVALIYRAEGTFKVCLIWATLIVIFRELAITSMRMIVSNSSGIVIAAAWLGKVKTVTQIVCVVTILLEPIVINEESQIISYIMMILMCVMTVWSGINYMKAYWQYLDPTK